MSRKIDVLSVSETFLKRWDSGFWVTNKLKLTTGWLLINSRWILSRRKSWSLHAAPQYIPLVKSENPTLRAANDIIVPVDTMRNLGITFDSAMTMKPCINNITRNCFYHLQCIRRIGRYLDDTTCAAVMQTLVISRLDYANSLLTVLPACTLRKLELVQNSAARLLTGTSRRADITPVLRELHWLPVARRITYKVLCLVHKALYEILAPAYLRSLPCERGNERELRSSAATTLMVPRSFRSYGDRAFGVYAPKMWNSLPLHLRNSTSLASI